MPIDKHAEMQEWWSGLCKNVLGALNSTGSSCDPEFRGLIDRIGKKFTDLSAPKSGEEQDCRTMQANVVSQLGEQLRAANVATRQNPHAQVDLFAAAMELADNDLPVAMDGYRLLSHRCTTFSKSIQTMCKKH